MIEHKKEVVEDRYLSSEELQYPEEEQSILRALRYLAECCDGGEDKDHAGFSRFDSEFGKSLAFAGRSWTGKQLMHAFKIANRYTRRQLTPAGFLLPDESAVQTLIRSKEERYIAKQQQYDNAPRQATATNQARIIGLRDGMLGVMFPNRASDFQENLSKIYAIEAEVAGARLAFRPDLPEVKFVEGIGKRSGEPMKYWQVPLEYAERVVQDFSAFHILPEVLEIVNAERRRIEEKHRVADEKAREDNERVERLLNAIGSLDEPVGGRTLYEHQREAVRTMIEWESGILAHDPGLGKTLSSSLVALAYMKAQGCRVIVVGPKTLRANWAREAGWVGVPIEYFTHDSIPVDIHGKFVLIVDEAQAYQSMQAKRSKKFLALAWKAVAVICATGTPSKNGRPSNIYPLLLACKHPLVYMEKSDGTPAHDQIKKLRRTFESKYCAAQPTEFSKWDVTGAAYLEELHKKIVDSPRGVLRRRKDQCLDLPSKIRKLVPVELSKAEAESYRNEVAAMWDEYQSRVEKKIREFKETKLQARIEANLEWWVAKCLAEKGDILEPGANVLERASAEDMALFKARLHDQLIEAERARIESGQALVMLGHFRHAGSRAKARATIDIIDTIFEEDAEETLEAEREGRPHKPVAVIIFCAYKDTAAHIAEKFGVPVMSGDTPDKARQPMVDDFQAGENRVFVGIYGAGGVGVTLTAANHVILVDRPWTPGEVEQAEDRAHRIGQGQAVICQWLQVPGFINPVDAKIDSILQQKQENVVMMLDGGTGNYDPDLLFSNMAVGLLHEATHFQASKEVEVGA